MRLSLLRVFCRFVAQVVILQMSIIPNIVRWSFMIGLWSESKEKSINPVIDSISRFPQENVCLYGFKSVGITAFMTTFFQVL